VHVFSQEEWHELKTSPFPQLCSRGILALAVKAQKRSVATIATDFIGKFFKI
jgi:hypothetical protein